MTQPIHKACTAFIGAAVSRCRQRFRQRTSATRPTTINKIGRRIFNIVLAQCLVLNRVVLKKSKSVEILPAESLVHIDITCRTMPCICDRAENLECFLVIGLK
jgi:hypothetical protein